MTKTQSLMIPMHVPNKTKQLFLHRVATDTSFSPELKMPNKETRLAMQELSSEQSKSFDTVEDLMKDLRAED